MTSEVDEIDAELRRAMNCWLTSHQQSRYARLLQIARETESLKERVMALEPMVKRIADRVRVYDRPPTPPITPLV